MTNIEKDKEYLWAKHSANCPGYIRGNICSVTGLFCVEYKDRFLCPFVYHQLWSQLPLT